MNTDIKLIITSPDGEKEWQQHATFVPAIGSTVTCRAGRDLHEEFTGIVDEVHYEVRKGFGVNEGNAQQGAIVSVWLREITK